MMEQILSFFIPNAYAETTAAPAQAGGMTSLVMMMVIFVLFLYFGVWRPQSRRAKEQQTLMDSLAKGDEVVTAGGILGRITKITDQYITLSVASNVDIVMQKSTIVSVLPKGTLKSIE